VLKGHFATFFSVKVLFVAVVLSSKKLKNHRESANAPKTQFKGDKLFTKMRILVSTPGLVLYHPRWS
jgi:hypothetical protein